MNKRVATILQNCINDLYKEYVKSQDVEVLDIINAMFPAVTIKDIYFEEDMENENPITLYSDKTFNENISLQNGYFLNLQNTIDAIKIKANVKNKSPKKKVAKSKAKKGKVETPKPTCTEVLDGTLSSANNSVLTRYTDIGGKKAFYGQLIINITSTKVGAVSNCFVKNNTIYFKVKEDKKKHSEWSMRKCGIKDKNGDVLLLRDYKTKE